MSVPASTHQARRVPAAERLEPLAAVARALADPMRLAILHLIASHQEPLCVCHLTDRLPVSQPTVSHHLRILRQAGLVTAERRGTWAYYEATDRGRFALEALDLLARSPASR